MRKILNRNEKGFTIIEVVLVLAIAGLIFLVVFLALPQLQQSRRDTQRKSDTGRFLAAMESYAGNNNGNYPTCVAATPPLSNFASYVPSNFDDPSEGAYKISCSAAAPDGSLTPPEPLVGTMYYVTSAKCSGDSVDISPTGAREIAVATGLESGQYCQDNQ